MGGRLKKKKKERRTLSEAIDDWAKSHGPEDPIVASGRTRLPTQKRKGRGKTAGKRYQSPEVCKLRGPIRLALNVSGNVTEVLYGQTALER